MFDAASGDASRIAQSASQAEVYVRVSVLPAGLHVGRARQIAGRALSSRPERSGVEGSVAA